MMNTKISRLLTSLALGSTLLLAGTSSAALTSSTSAKNGHRGQTLRKLQPSCPTLLNRNVMEVEVTDEIHHSQHSRIRQLINSFYGWNGEQPRYKVDDFPQKPEIGGKYLNGEKQVVVDYNEHNIVAFHRLPKDATGQGYIATFGVGVIVLKRYFPLADSDQGKSEIFKTITEDRKQREFLKEHGVATAEYIDHFTSGEQTYLVKHLTVGYPLEQLQKMFEAGEISDKQWHSISQQLEDTLSQIRELEASQEFQTFATDNAIPHGFALSHNDFLYHNGEWKLF